MSEAARKVELDTSVLVAAARSRLGASFALISSIPTPEFQPCLSVALYAEWQQVLTRAENLPPGTSNVKDFRGAEQLGVTALTPREFLALIRKTS